MPKRQLIAEEWDKFARLALPPNVGAIQRKEMRLAFYAGASSLMVIILKYITPGDEPEENFQMLEDIREELQRFGRELIKT